MTHEKTYPEELLRQLSRKFLLESGISAPRKTQKIKVSNDDWMSLVRWLRTTNLKPREAAEIIAQHLIGKK